MNFIMDLYQDRKTRDQLMNLNDQLNIFDSCRLSLISFELQNYFEYCR